MSLISFICFTPHIVALFLILRNGNLPTRLSRICSPSWTMNLGSIHTVERYAAVIANDLEVCPVVWTDFTNRMVSDRSQTQKGAYRVIVFVRTTRTGKANGIQAVRRQESGHAWGRIGSGREHGCWLRRRAHSVEIRQAELLPSVHFSV